jgi:hypothetical protein
MSPQESTSEINPSTERNVVLAKEATPCETCGHPSSAPRLSSQGSYIYAIGKIEPRFPNRSLEKEFAQIVSRTQTKGLTDQQTLQKVLSQKENRYIARKLCWVFSVESVETYILIPQDQGDLDLLIESVRASPSPMDIDVVIGKLGPFAPPEICNGLTIPAVIFSQLYSFDQGTLINSIPKPKSGHEEIFNQSAIELLQRVMHLANNNGASNANRSLNYLVVRYPAIYSRIAEAYAENYSLTGVEVNPSNLGHNGRSIEEVVFSFTNRNTDVIDKWFVRVDVGEEFPFLVTKLSPYYSR